MGSRSENKERVNGQPNPAEHTTGVPSQDLAVSDGSPLSGYPNCVSRSGMRKIAIGTTSRDEA